MAFSRIFPHNSRISAIYDDHIIPPGEKGAKKILIRAKKVFFFRIIFALPLNSSSSSFFSLIIFHPDASPPDATESFRAWATTKNSWSEVSRLDCVILYFAKFCQRLTDPRIRTISPPNHKERRSAMLLCKPAPQLMIVFEPFFIFTNIFSPY